MVSIQMFPMLISWSRKSMEFIIYIGNLMDKSLKAIAESFPGLRSTDLTNLCNLTDTTIGHLDCKSRCFISKKSTKFGFILVNLTPLWFVQIIIIMMCSCDCECNYLA